MQDFEKLGVFYLGREFDPAAGRATDNLVLYDAKDLTTHALMVGALQRRWIDVSQDNVVVAARGEQLGDHAADFTGA